jgi:hypothetical protein
MPDRFPDPDFDLQLDTQAPVVSDSENESDEDSSIDIHASLATQFMLNPVAWLENNRHRSQSRSHEDASSNDWATPIIRIIPPQDSEPQDSPETPDQPENATSRPQERERHLYANPNRWSLYVHGSNDKNLESFKKFLDDDFLVKTELEVLREFLIMNLAGIAEKINERNNLIIDTGSNPTTGEDNERLQALQAQYANGDY